MNICPGPTRILYSEILLHQVSFKNVFSDVYCLGTLALECEWECIYKKTTDRVLVLDKPEKISKNLKGDNYLYSNRLLLKNTGYCVGKCHLQKFCYFTATKPQTEEALTTQSFPFKICIFSLLSINCGTSHCV